MQRRYVRLVLALLAAAASSFVVGFVVAETVGMVPCQGEGLACNIDAAVGGYGVIFAAIAGPIIFGAALLIAPSRIVLGWTLAVLLAVALISSSIPWRRRSP
jgi:nitrate/nitrite transporter NarK